MTKKTTYVSTALQSRHAFVLKNMAPFVPLTSSPLCSPETPTHSDGHARTGFANAVSRCVSLSFLFPSLKYLENITCQSNVRELQLEFASQTVIYDAGASPGTRAGPGLKLPIVRWRHLYRRASPGTRAGRGLKPVHQHQYFPIVR